MDEQFKGSVGFFAGSPLTSLIRHIIVQLYKDKPQERGIIHIEVNDNKTIDKNKVEEANNSFQR